MTSKRRVFIGRNNSLICFGQTGTVYPFAIMGGELIQHAFFKPDGNNIMYPCTPNEVFDCAEQYPDAMP